MEDAPSKPSPGVLLSFATVAAVVAVVLLIPDASYSSTSALIDDLRDEVGLHFT